MLPISRARELTAVVVPVYFSPEVDGREIRSILENTFADNALFCHPERVLAVVDRETRAEAVLLEAKPDSSFYGLPVHILEVNQGKAGAVREGLSELLKRTDVSYFVTRDCDGDHVIEDLPRMVSLADAIGRDTGKELITVFGVRPSLAKPMGWVREAWERLTNAIFLDAVQFLLAREGRILNQRYWNGYPLDAQSGYRVYSRRAAERAVECLSGLPDDRTLLTFACELLPFVALALEGGVIGQVQRLTLVEQPVSSYRNVSLAGVYGRLLQHLLDRYAISLDQLLEIFDNHLVATPLYFTDFREDLLECRRQLAPEAPPPWLARFL